MKMAQAAGTSPSPEPTLEIIPDGPKLTVAITLDRFTTFQIAGWTEQILDLAKTILAADSKWMPVKIRAFAHDALAFKRATVFPIDEDPEALSFQAENESESEQAKKTLEALKQLRSFVRGVFYDASEQLKKQAVEWSDEDRPTRIQ